jgi:indolepyruvate ferredoxin oxidoreductase beta subunit
MEFKLVVAGVGGQGILFATRLLEDAALAMGLPVIGAETHGMAQRGGSVLSHFKVGPFRSPMVRRGTADGLLGMNLQESYRNAGYLRPSGVAFLNCGGEEIAGSRVVERLRDRGVELWTYHADGAAMRLGSPALANVALLGCAAAHPRFPFEPDQIRAAIERVSPVRYRELNLTALDEGHAHGLLLAEGERSSTALPGRQPD